MTKIIKEDNIDEAARCLSIGGLVAFPTETVYGLGADAFNDVAVDNIYRAKGRPGDNPLIVHIGDKSDVVNLANEISPNAHALIDKFWPGPLTIIFPKKSTVPFRVTGGLDTVAVRCPSNHIASELIKKSGKYIAAPSANLSGSPSPTSCRHVVDDLYGRVDYIIECDTCDIGLESTVIDLTCDVPTILRPGIITLDMIKEILPDAVLDSALLNPQDKPKCPGMKYKHYSPKADVEVVCGDKENVVDYISGKIQVSTQKCGVLTYKGGDYENASCVLNAGYDMSEYASTLYYNLRVYDENHVEKVYVEFCDEGGVGDAVKNRLYKAAGNNVVRV